MAITSARMQIKRGNEVDFDSEKMLVGEWALSTDKRIVRICVDPNVCIRMATYDAFEVDMAKVEKILEECQSIEDAVELINSQVSDKLDATIEYANQAKQYRDEAKTFRDEAKQFAPDGYVELQETVASNTAKIDTIIEKAELNIKNTASGENLHLTDSADSKAVSFNLYGKAEQKQYSGKNVIGYENLQNANEVAYENDVYTITQVPTTSYRLWQGVFEENTRYTFSGMHKQGVAQDIPNVLRVVYTDGTYENMPSTKSTTYSNFAFTSSADKTIDYIRNLHQEGVLIVEDFQCEKGTQATPYEPFVNCMPSPNPDYPQDITVSGSDGSVEVVSCGKNLLNNTAESKTVNGVAFTVNEDKSISVDTANGTATANASIWVDVILHKGKYIVSGCPSGGSGSTYSLMVQNQDYSKTYWDVGKGVTIDVEKDNSLYHVYMARVANGAKVNNLTFYPMIRLESDTDSTYQPYTETLSTIPTPNGLCGIKVSSGGNYTDENGQQWICDEIVKYADGSGKRVQRIGKAVFDGSDDETWLDRTSEYTQKVGNQRRYSTTTISDYKLVQNIPCMSNVGYTGILTGKEWYKDNGVCLYWLIDSTTRIAYVTIEVDSITDLDTFKSWLVSNNITVYYELAEPIITDLTAEEIAEIEKLHTFYPVTNLSNDADCGMSITYLCDAKNYIDQRLALIESAMLNNI